MLSGPRLSVPRCSGAAQVGDSLATELAVIDRCFRSALERAAARAGRADTTAGPSGLTGLARFLPHLHWGSGCSILGFITL